MKYDQIMIRYGELSTKGRNRKGFVAKLKRNVKNALRDFEGIDIQATRDRMYIILNGTEYAPIADILKGICQFSQEHSMHFTILHLRRRTGLRE